MTQYPYFWASGKQGAVHSEVTVVFRSKRGDRLKILVWDGTGMVLIYKTLEQGSFA